MSIPVNVTVERNGASKTISDYANAIKQEWVKQGNYVKDLKKLDLYIKPEDGKVYFVAGNGVKGFIYLDSDVVYFDD